MVSNTGRSTAKNSVAPRAQDPEWHAGYNAKNERGEYDGQRRHCIRPRTDQTDHYKEQTTPNARRQLATCQAIKPSSTIMTVGGIALNSHANPPRIWSMGHLMDWKKGRN